MPDPSWEPSNNTWSYGYLKFLDFQSAGYDVHVTFQKDKKAHVSIYNLGGAKLTPPGNLWMTIGTYGMGFDQSRVTALKNAVSPKSAFPAVPGYTHYGQFFLTHCNKQALSLGMISKKPQPKPPAPTFVASDFPPLGSPK